MNSYLDLISKYSKVHKKQNRMTMICIIISVFLVTVIFSLANVAVNMEFSRLEMKHWISGLSEIFSSTTVQTMYWSALFLFILVFVAGVLMISNSMNTNIIQRTSFFGILRCIWMTKKQIRKYVKFEALNRCKFAIPIWVVLWIIVTWWLWAILRFLVWEEFAEIQIFWISRIGIICGVLVWIITVLISSISSAKKTSKVSPIVALSWNINKSKHCIGIKSNIKIESILWINTAISQKKRLILMVWSFSLSIILFLTFSVLIQLVNYLLPQFSNESDIEIFSVDWWNNIQDSFVDEISNIDCVKNIYGRANYFDLSMKINENDTEWENVDLISYDDFDLDCLVKDKLLKRWSDISKIYGANSGVILVWNKNNQFDIGDEIVLWWNSEQLRVLLKLWLPISLKTDL